MTCVAASSTAEPTSATRRAGAACLTGVEIRPAAPALAAAPPAKIAGRENRALCQAGTAVFAISAPVYVASGRPSTAAEGLARRARWGKSPSAEFNAAIPAAGAVADSTHEP